MTYTIAAAGIGVKLLARAYGTDVYGGSTYDCPETQVCEIAATGSSVGAPSTGVAGESYIGYTVLVPIILAASVLFAVVVAVIKKKRVKRNGA